MGLITESMKYFSFPNTTVHLALRGDIIHSLQEYTQKLESDNQKLKDDLDDAAKEADALRATLPKEGETVVSNGEVTNLQKLAVLERDIIEKDRCA